MSEEQFLKSTLRQILILEETHNNYFKNNLREVISETINVFLGDSEEEKEIYVESFSDLF
ncbi:hypothetical protein [Clostridium sartagoforme]|uniref:hypothetical protein n=1 Tax=Clostridium sartagoforme TaxID=84031 RepID=UPI0012FBF399|nr:hypothetical protein [Clostridium sartagoforme]